MRYSEYAIDKWLDSLTPEEVGELRWGNSVFVPVSGRLYKKMNGTSDILDKYIERKNNVVSSTDYKDYAKYYNDIRERWRLWDVERDRKRTEEQHRQLEIMREHDAKRAAEKAKWDAMMKS
jgi:accessory colonization factor AcfC